MDIFKGGFYVYESWVWYRVSFLKLLGNII